MTRLTLPAIALALSVADPGLAPVRLPPESAAGWTAYAAATERRIERELASPDRFLGMDFGTSPVADRRAVLAGNIVVREIETRGDRGQALEVPSAMLHHWRGAVLIPKAILNDVMTTLQSSAPEKQEDVLKSAVLARGPDWTKVYLKLQRKKFVTAVYNTEHLVRFRRQSPVRASSMSTATKIAELTDVGTPREHELPAGDDRGFLWRLNAYWRYEEVPGGVIAECESISLSRDIPLGLGYFVMPMVRSAASESMERTLTALKVRNFQMPRESSPAR